ncbi:MAG: hypothetical protein WCF96_01510 [Eubacteriales bacterium]
MIDKEILGIIFPFIMVVVFIVGISSLFLGSLILAYRKYKLHNGLLTGRVEKVAKSKMETHLANVLGSTTGKKISIKKFKSISLLIFSCVFLLGLINFSIIQALSYSLISISFPYLILRIKLENDRRKSSFEGETLIINILTQYRIHSLNIFETLESVIKDSNELKATKKILFKLLISIRNTGNEAKTISATKMFAFSINTNWSRMLGNNIQLAAIKGMDISNALEDILIQLRAAAVQAEERKRLNAEAVRMTIFMVPFMYLATIFMSVKYLDLSFGDFIKNQFHTSQGFMLFLLTIFLFLINLMLIEIINNQSFDY